MNTTSQSIFNIFLTFSSILLFSNLIHAEVGIKDFEREYKVTIDSVPIKATPYKKIERDGVIYDKEKKIDFYNDIVIYEIKSYEAGNAISMNGKSSVANPAIFMLPGGGFFWIK
ncbi:MAG: hypothetical protein M9958_03580 [Chitinophagales bacterium]|nr:hypothetical protein [Chitinophagales bacterium]